MYRMMRPLLLLFVLANLTLQGQHLTHREWLIQSFRDMRLAPAFGGRAKNAEQLASDSTFVAQMLAVNPDRHACAEHLLDLGFGLLREGDLVHAMYRFNHAYLMEPDNPRIRQAYGAFFVALDRPDEAAAEYKKGLSLDTANVPLMIDMASVCLGEYYKYKDDEPEKADRVLSTADILLKRAVALEPQNAVAGSKYAVSRLLRGSCADAWKWYRQSRALDPGSIEAGFPAVLQGRCPEGGPPDGTR